jgi:hypothetical protein
MSTFPRQIAGRVTAETGALIDEAEQRFGVTEGALVRMAVEDYLPRFLANQGRPQHAELFAKLAQAIDERPELLNEVTALTRKAVRRRGVAAK